MENKKRVTGLGGIFFKSRDPQQLNTWYKNHLGIPVTEYGASFEWRALDIPEDKGSTQWSPFPDNTPYFEPSKKEFMINYRVADLEALVATLRNEGRIFLDEIESHAYGKFIHLLDPEGNKIELWEPA